MLYTQIIDKEMSPSTHFVTNVELQQATWETISSVIIEEFRKRGVKPPKITSLGSDGESIMTGNKTGNLENKKNKKYKWSARTTCKYTRIYQK